MHGCESWNLKKAESPGIDAFELWCWRRLLRVPWTARRSNQLSWRKSVLNWKDWCWSWNSNTLATWREELTHWERPWCWERLKVGGVGDGRGWDGWWHHWLNGRKFVQTPRGTGKTGVWQSIGSQMVGQDWVTELNWYNYFNAFSIFLCLKIC